MLHLSILRQLTQWSKLRQSSSSSSTKYCVLSTASILFLKKKVEKFTYVFPCSSCSGNRGWKCPRVSFWCRVLRSHFLWDRERPSWSRYLGMERTAGRRIVLILTIWNLYLDGLRDESSVFLSEFAHCVDGSGHCRTRSLGGGQTEKSENDFNSFHIFQNLKLWF